ncbi:unnamed protein product, partial [Ectocarpus sp. 12 AP-2014]
CTSGRTQPAVRRRHLVPLQPHTRPEGAALTGQKLEAGAFASLPVEGDNIGRGGQANTALQQGVAVDGTPNTRESMEILIPTAPHDEIGLTGGGQSSTIDIW